MRAWAIKGPDGKFDCVFTDVGDEDEAWATYLEDSNWTEKRCMENGYRCVEVEITEVQPEDRKGERRVESLISHLRATSGIAERRGAGKDRRTKAGTRNDRKDK